MDSKIERLKRLTDKIVSYEVIRKENIKILRNLYEKLELKEKIENFNDIFKFKAINLSGISLDNENFGKIQPKKYIQIIGIKKVDSKLKNINLKYFGRSEKIDNNLKKDIVNFVIRWRLEKSFLQVDHYKNLLKRENA